MPKKKFSTSQESRSVLADQAWLMAWQGNPFSVIAEHLLVSTEEARKLVWEAGSKIRDQGVKAIRQKNAVKQSEPTPEDFLEWLEKEAVPRLAGMKVWPMGATRFTYFHSEACWNYQVLTTVEIVESEHADRHISGDRKAIFEFAKSNREALYKDWVVRQLVDWRLCGEQQLFDKFMRAYWSQQGKRTAGTMLNKIKRDLAIYKDSISVISTSLNKELANKHDIGPNTVKEVLRHYRAAYDWWKASKLSRLFRSTHSPARI